MLPIVASLPGYVVSTVASLLLHPRIYHEESSRFARLRGGPAIGVVLIVISAIHKRAFIRAELERGDGDTTTGDLLALIWASAEVGAGVFTADLLRGWNFNGE